MASVQEYLERDISDAKDNGYPLGGGYQAAARLNLQHFLWQEIIGYTIHPSIKLPKQPMVVDVATGTGMWPLSVAQQYPEASVVASDIDLSFLPPSQWLPSNLKTCQWNIFEDPPEDMVGRFDLVHVRLIFLALTGKDPQPIVERLSRLLKPGGWLQWDEFDRLNVFFTNVQNSGRTPGYGEIMETCQGGGGGGGGVHDWVLKIPDNLERGGFRPVQAQQHFAPDRLIPALSSVTLMTTAELVSTLSKPGKATAAAQLSKTIDTAYSESVRGVGLRYAMHVAVAQKPE